MGSNSALVPRAVKFARQVAIPQPSHLVAGTQKISQPAHSFNPAVFKQDDLVGPLQLDYLCVVFLVRTNKCSPYGRQAISYQLLAISY